MKNIAFVRPKWQALASYLTSLMISESVTKENKTQQQKILPFVVITLIVLGLTVVFWKIGYVFTLVNIVLLYLLPVLIAAVRWGIWTSFYAAVAGVVAFDYFFVPPLFTFTVFDARYLISFTVYLAVATFTAGLASQLRQRFHEARARETVTSALFSLSTRIAATGDLDSTLTAIVRQSFETFGMSAAIILPNSSGQLNIRAAHAFQDFKNKENVDPLVTQWVYEHGEIAGSGTKAYKDSSFVYVPLRTESKIHGVMCFANKNPLDIDRVSNRIHVIQALSGLAAVSIARINFEEEAQIAQITAESERLRTVLLDSISHELRTPLATIIGAATALTESSEFLSTNDQNELLFTMREGAMRMNRLVTNLLDMVRLESGMLQLNKDWCDISDIIGVALRHIQDSLQTREVAVNIPENFPVISVDDVLIEQVLVNLLSNAIKYSPNGSPIHIDVMNHDGIMNLCIRDWGIGIQPGESEKIFDKFYRSPLRKSIPGTGLGLAICKGIILAHGGEIFARNAGVRADVAAWDGADDVDAGDAGADVADETGLIVTIRLPIGDSDGFLDETQFQSKETSSWEQKF